MYFNLATLFLALAVVGHESFASPVTSGTSFVEVADVSSLVVTTRTHGVANSNTSALVIPFIGGSNSLPNTGVHAFVAPIVTAPVDSFIICSGAACTGTCMAFPFSELSDLTCYTAPFGFMSAEPFTTGDAITTDSFAGLQACEGLINLRFPNQCVSFLVNGVPGDLTTFFIGED